MPNAWKYNDNEDYDEFTARQVTVRDLIDYLTQYLSESSEGEGREQSSHNAPFGVYIFDEDGEYYTLAGAELSRRMGCGCEDGINLRIKKFSPDNGQEEV